MEKKNILLQVNDLEAEQLYQFIIQGKVGIDDLMGTGELNVKKRQEIEKLLKEVNQEDEDAWSIAQFGNETSLRDYISNFPKGKFVQNAVTKIKELEKDRQRIEENRYRVLDDLRKNINKYDTHEIREYLNNGTLDRSDLIELDVPEEVIDLIFQNNEMILELGETPDSIPKEYTEVYFWGVPGSGKTCALAAILGTSHKLGILDMAVGTGFNYMTKLKNIFIERNALLPPPSPVETTQYLPFVLKKPNKRDYHSISLIELSGEIFQCFFRKNAGLDLPSQAHVETFESLNRFLNGGNRKIHFFFIDFSKDNKLDTSGYTQGDYLQSAATYFKNNKVFDKSTDAIYVVLTKSDLMSCSVEERVAEAKEHIKNQNFSAFINALKDNCEKYSINGGRLYIEPFSLGSVYFQEICDFDSTSASRIIDILFQRVPSSRKSLLDVFNQ